MLIGSQLFFGTDVSVLVSATLSEQNGCDTIVFKEMTSPLKTIYGGTARTVTRTGATAVGGFCGSEGTPGAWRHSR